VRRSVICMERFSLSPQRSCGGGGRGGVGGEVRDTLFPESPLLLKLPPLCPSLAATVPVTEIEMARVGSRARVRGG